MGDSLRFFVPRRWEQAVISISHPSPGGVGVMADFYMQKHWRASERTLMVWKWSCMQDEDVRSVWCLSHRATILTTHNIHPFCSYTALVFYDYALTFPREGTRPLPPTLSPHRIPVLSNAELHYEFTVKYIWFSKYKHSTILYLFCRYPLVANVLYMANIAGLLGTRVSSPYFGGFFWVIVCFW